MNKALFLAGIQKVKTGKDYNIYSGFKFRVPSKLIYFVFKTFVCRHVNKLVYELGYLAVETIDFP